MAKVFSGYKVLIIVFYCIKYIRQCIVFPRTAYFNIYNKSIDYFIQLQLSIAKKQMVKKDLRS